MNPLSFFAALALSPLAHAGTPGVEPIWTTEVEGEVVRVQLHVRTLSKEPVDVQIRNHGVGQSLVHVVVNWEEPQTPEAGPAELALSPQMYQPMSRRGSFARWSRVDADSLLLVGSWVFPIEVGQQALTLEGALQTSAGELVLDVALPLGEPQS